MHKCHPMYCTIGGGEISNMVKNEDSGSPSWSASLFMQTIEDVARVMSLHYSLPLIARSPRPSVVFSSKDDNGNSPLHKLQHQVSRVLKGFSQPPEVKSGTYNPEVLTSQKRQWASVQLQSPIFIFISSKTFFGPGAFSCSSTTLKLLVFFQAILPYSQALEKLAPHIQQAWLVGLSLSYAVIEVYFLYVKLISSLLLCNRNTVEIFFVICLDYDASL
ncbi:hypothetical protein LOK49_Contig309G00002 [Camellia lanceoleosa]|nr:hypothetical protein LOK49_Contig309G00002 [Camellia lanceoleosa]